MVGSKFAWRVAVLVDSNVEIYFFFAPPVMNTESVIQFCAALKRRDDPSALSLLAKGRITTQSAYIYEVHGIRYSDPIIFLAIEFVREDVARALVGLGVSVDTFRDLGTEDSVNPAGDAIRCSNGPALSLSHRLGATLTCVYRTADSSPKIHSGLSVAIGQAKHVPLIYLLDKILQARPVRLSRNELVALFVAASRGSPAKMVLRYCIVEGSTLRLWRKWNTFRMAKTLVQRLRLMHC